MKAARSQGGVALALVVWFIAGMALLVSGIVADARIDTRMAQLHYFRAQVAAAGDGAINLALADQFGREQGGRAGMGRRLAYTLGVHNVDVRMIPVGLFVNISTASEGELRDLFELAVNSTDASPRELAASVIAFRDLRGDDAFFSPEDVLRVSGVDRSVFDAVRDYITVANLGGEGAPGTGDTTERIESIAAAMRGQGKLMQGQVQPNAGSLRVDAVVELGGQYWVRRRWVQFEPASHSALPWRILRSEAARPLPNEDWY